MLDCQLWFAKENKHFFFFFSYSHSCAHYFSFFDMQGRIPPREPFLETQEKRVIRAGRKQRVGFTTR